MLRLSFATHWKNYLASLQLSDTRKVERTALQTKRQFIDLLLGNLLLQTETT